MSKFFSEKFSKLVAYTPGEQPKNRTFVKLNTNESPFPPIKEAVEIAKSASENTHLYSDPECSQFRSALAKSLGVTADMTIATNGSDEVLHFAFMAFCDDKTPAIFPDITYGFYSVFAELLNIPYKTVPLKEDFTINIDDYKNCGSTIFIANPNAPTGIALSLSEIEEIVKSNPENVVVIDEAYVDFGGESAVSLVPKYNNLLVTGTFSKSRSMAGARLGFGIAQKELICDLETLRYSTNPYNVNSITLAMGKAVLDNDAITKERCKKIIENREWTKARLSELGFEFPDSKANFVFARHPEISGEDVYKKLREKGVLVRHFSSERICDYNRITIGSLDDMKVLIGALREILEEK